MVTNMEKTEFKTKVSDLQAKKLPVIIDNVVFPFPYAYNTNGDYCYMLKDGKTTAIFNISKINEVY